MTCKELVEVVTEYLEGTLPPHDRAQFEAHLAECEGCSAHLDQMRRTISLVGHISEETLTEESRIELLKLFRDWRKSKSEK
ncbi:MAG: anti-sigma factor [Chloroflexi bacterium]|nr:anti-sigma factor [Chloroflexota bacterium]